MPTFLDDVKCYTSDYGVVSLISLSQKVPKENLYQVHMELGFSGTLNDSTSSMISGSLYFLIPSSTYISPSSFSALYPILMNVGPLPVSGALWGVSVTGIFYPFSISIVNNGVGIKYKGSSTNPTSLEIPSTGVITYESKKIY